MTSGIGMQARRGGFLTVMAVLLPVAALVDLLKAFTTPPPPGHRLMESKMPPTGIVVLGVRHTGPDATILGLLLAAILFFYAVGIWRMKRYAMTVAWIYAAYVILNVALFTIRNPRPPTPGAMIFAIVYMSGAIVLTAGVAIALTRRKAELS
jgi:hypothetical protein